MLNKKDDDFLSYNPSAFAELEWLFGRTRDLYGLDDRELGSFYDRLPGGLKNFIGPEEWLSKINEIRNNTSAPESFLKRFYSWFNMFKVVKYLNFVHNGQLDKRPVVRSASELVSSMGASYVPDDPEELLFCYRIMERFA